MIAHYWPVAGTDWLQSRTKYGTRPLAGLFISLIFMLMVPWLFSEMVTDVSEIGNILALARTGGRTLAYTALLSCTPVLVGLALVNVMKPGIGVVRHWPENF